MIAEFMKRLHSAVYRFCFRLWSSGNGDWSVLEGPDPWDEAYFLEPPDDGDKDQDIRFLRLQLTKLRADNTELKDRADNWRATFEKTLNMTEEQLQMISAQYDILAESSNSHWFVPVERCIFCGCPLDAAVFRTRRDALLYAALLQTVGYRPRHNRCCSSCYAQQEETNEISIE